jgi:hypothetical protein
MNKTKAGKKQGGRIGKNRGEIPAAPGWIIRHRLYSGFRRKREPFCRVGVVHGQGTRRRGVLGKKDIRERAVVAAHMGHTQDEQSTVGLTCSACWVLYVRIGWFCFYSM